MYEKIKYRKPVLLWVIKASYPTYTLSMCGTRCFSVILGIWG